MVCVKMEVSGKKVTIVPLPSASPIIFAGYKGFPFEYSCSQIFQSKYTVALKCSERAFTTETPTPCYTPDTL